MRLSSEILELIRRLEHKMEEYELLKREVVQLRQEIEEQNTFCLK